MAYLSEVAPQDRAAHRSRPTQHTLLSILVLLLFSGYGFLHSTPAYGQTTCTAGLSDVLDWDSVTSFDALSASDSTATLRIPFTISIADNVAGSSTSCVDTQLFSTTANHHGTNETALNYKTDDARAGCTTSESVVRIVFQTSGIRRVTARVYDIDESGATWDDIIIVEGIGSSTLTPSATRITDTGNVQYDSGTNRFTVIAGSGNVGNTANNGNVEADIAFTDGQSITEVRITHIPQGNGRIGIGDIDFCADGFLPVELTSFDATLDGPDVLLRWKTASETNNAGFYVEMAPHEPNPLPGKVEKTFTQLGFVEGFGTTEWPQSYQYRVRALDPGTYTFRLKQIDFDGTFEYSPEVETLIEVPTTHLLSGAYPNPFNPEAQFTLSVRQEQHVRVEVYNMLGRVVAQLHDGPLSANTNHTFTIDGTHLTSGTYFYRVTGQSFSESRPVMLVK
ncbi:MAG: T9SS type A sorting domain-containing protein [Rhodothermales bacterium]